MIFSFRKKLTSLCFIVILNFAKHLLLSDYTNISSNAIIATAELKNVIPELIVEPNRILVSPSGLSVQKSTRGGTVYPHVKKPYTQPIIPQTDGITKSKSPAPNNSKAIIIPIGFRIFVIFVMISINIKVHPIRSIVIY